MGNPTRKPGDLRRVPGERQRAGRHFEAIRASIRRLRMRAVGEGAPSGESTVTVTATAAFTVEGIRTLYLREEAARKGSAPPAGAEAARFVRAIERLAGRCEVSDGDDAGTLRLSIGLAPGGLRVGLDLGQRQPYAEANGALLELRFRFGPTLREPIAGAGALFPAGAALLETKDLLSMAIEFPNFGRLRLAPLAP
jgi:hypothetical protein